MSKGNAEQVPVIPGLFTMGPEQKLIGTKCTSCGTHYFPQALSCSNPLCKDKKVEQCLLSKRGKLWTYTFQYYPPPAPFKMDPFVPYGVGLIELPEKVRVVGILTETDPQKLKIGMEMELVIDKMYEEGGKDYVTWKFKSV